MFQKRKEPDLRDLLDNGLLEFAYRTLVGIVQTFYRMALAGAVILVLLVVIGLALA